MSVDFTVVVPAYNASSGLPPTLAAVLAQEKVDLEVVVVDDGSTDDTAAIAADSEDSRVRLIRQPNRGVSAARNTGLAAARGHWVTFLDCDDLPEPIWLATYVALLDQPDVVAAYVGATYRDAGGRKTAARRPEPHGPAFHDITALLLSGTMAARVDFLRSLGGYCTGLAFSENTELGLRMAEAMHRQGKRAEATTESVLNLYDPGAQRSRAYSSLARFESARYIVGRHHHLMRREPRLLGIYYSMLGVDTVRLRRRGSTAYFAKAVLVDPTQPRHLARLAISLVPPVRSRIWPPDPAAPSQGHAG